MAHEMRGHYGIAMAHPTHEENIGAVARATGCFDADYMALIGREYSDHPASVGHERHTPIWQFPDFNHLVKSLPYDTEIVAVDVDDDATDITQFEHPQRALYVLGQEGPGFEKHREVLSAADRTVYIESEYCLNVAVAGNVVLQDRYVSQSGGDSDE